MDKVYFLIRYTPFWAVPMFLLAGEFAYVAWIRKKKKWLTFCLFLLLFSVLSLLYYFWAGGPERSVQYAMKMVRFYTY